MSGQSRGSRRSERVLGRGVPSSQQLQKVLPCRTGLSAGDRDEAWGLPGPVPAQVDARPHPAQNSASRCAGASERPKSREGGEGRSGEAAGACAPPGRAILE